MTLERLIETGSGSLAVRVEIEGMPIQFVSDEGMELTQADGRRRVYCFCVFGEGASTLTIEESVNLPEAVLEAGGVNLRLYETQDEDLSGCFHHAPSLMQWVSEKIAAADTTINLLGTTGIAADDVVHIGTEAIKVGAVTSTQLTGCTRGHWGTIARDIWTSGDDSGSTNRAILTDRPLRVRGRRVRIYLYGDGDSLTGDGGNGGEPVWRGMVTADPRWDQSGTSVSLSIGPLTKLFESKLGGELDVPMGARGIYYSWAAPLRVQAMEQVTATTARSSRTLLFTGHYETQQAFVDALTAAMVSEFSALMSSFAAVLTTDGGWTVEATVGSGIGEVSVAAWSHQDGETSVRAEDMLDEDGDPVGFATPSLGDKHYAVWNTTPPGGRGVPRGVFGLPDGGPGTSSEPPRVPGDSATYPHMRVYLDRGIAADWTSVSVEWPGPLDANRQHPIASGGVSLARNSIDLLREPGSGGVSGPGWSVYTRATPATIRPLRHLASGGIEDLRAALVTESITYGDRGTAPFVTSDDVASWADVAALAERFAWQRERWYQLASTADLDEVLSAEFRLRGVYPITDSTGKIALAQIKVPNSSLEASASIDEEITSVGWSSMERGGQTINRWKMKRGYDPVEDEWLGGVIDPFDVTSYAQDHQDRTLDVEPRSISQAGDETIAPEEVADAALPVLALFGYPHDFVHVNVSWKLFNVRLGDVVSFSADHLPSYVTGARPLNAIAGIVTKRRWTLGEAHGQLTLLCSWANVAGYSPSVKITGQFNQTGNTWRLACSAIAYPSGTDHTDWWQVGDRVRVRKRDSETASAINGTVTSRGATTIIVTFDSTWTPGSDSWGLGFAPYTDGSLDADQKRFAAMAGDDAVLGASDTARTYGA